MDRWCALGDVGSMHAFTNEHEHTHTPVPYTHTDTMSFPKKNPHTMATDLGNDLAHVLVHGLARLDAREGARQAVEGAAHELAPLLIDVADHESL